MFSPIDHRKNVFYSVPIFVCITKKKEILKRKYSFSYQVVMHHHLSCRHGMGSDLWFFCGFPDSEFEELCGRENERKRMRERRAVILFYEHRKSFESIKISWSTFVTRYIKGFAVIIVLYWTLEIRSAHMVIHSQSRQNYSKHEM